jgi:FdhD protein
MKDVGSVDYEIHRVEGLTREISADCIAIEEPLEIIVRYYKDNDWFIEPLMVTIVLLIQLKLTLRIKGSMTLIIL